MLGHVYSSMSSTWLDSLSFLSDTQRAALRALDLDSPDAVAAFTAERLEARVGLSLGNAGRLITAAGAGSKPPPPTSVTVQIAEAPSASARVSAALDAAAADPTRIPGLLEVGVESVVVGTAERPDDDVINVMATRAALAHAAGGAPIGSTWGGLRVVSVRELTAPKIYCNPRTGRPLQDGRDEISLVPLGELGLEGLRLLAFGARAGFFDNRSDELVLNDLKNSSALRARIAAKAKADGVELASMDALVIWRASRRRPAADIDDPPAGAGAAGGSPLSQLTDLFLSLFSSDEFLRFLRFGQATAALVPELPSGPVAPAKLFFEAVELMRRRGLINVDLRERLVAERGRSATRIRDVFAPLISASART